MADRSQHIAIVGAGLVGSLLSIYLAKRGYRISVFERRGDMRRVTVDAGKSINLALSDRGLRALSDTGVDGDIAAAAIPMNGRMMHDVKGNLSFLPYGKQGQYINSISRAHLNIILLNAAERVGVKFYFHSKCAHVDVNNTELSIEHLENPASGETKQVFDQIIGADGSWSTVRAALQHTDRFSYSQSFIDHGYKEFTIPASESGKFQIEKNALHIWPRQSFMMIALPNPDSSFTATLFFPWQGHPSFSTLTNDAAIKDFFESLFPDFTTLAPDYLSEFHTNPTGSLATIQCWPWVKKNVFTIGDAAHGIVPFYGQGMNAGFEDCRILNKLLDECRDDWGVALSRFEQSRKPDTDAIAKLALDNFIEMRDLVGDANFLLRKKIESHLSSLFPEKWIPLYSMVTFRSDIRYSDALAIGIKQRKIMDDVMKLPEIESRWSGMDFRAIVDQLG